MIVDEKMKEILQYKLTCHVMVVESPLHVISDTLIDFLEFNGPS